MFHEISHVVCSFRNGLLYFVMVCYLLQIKVKWSRYRPGVAQRVDTGVALLFHDHGT